MEFNDLSQSADIYHKLKVIPNTMGCGFLHATEHKNVATKYIWSTSANVFLFFLEAILAGGDLWAALL